jgi:DNA repair exonuclease SbcCD nuclease subunit
MKFIHCADVHLDTPLQGLAEYPGAPTTEIRNATRRAFEKVLDAALTEQVDFLVIAGDLYDTGLKSFESALFFNKEMARLADAAIEVYLIYGNHDAASKLIKQLRPPKNVHVFRTHEPQTFKNETARIALHGQSFPTPEVTEDLAAKYPLPIEGFFNIGVLHTNLGGFSDHANYAPCSLQTLKNKGYDYWALGHVHNRQIIATNPYIVYPGNIQGRHGKELGEKSCELVNVSDAGAITTTPISTSVVPWIQLGTDASHCLNADAVYEQLRTDLGGILLQSKERVTAVRVVISGATDAHAELSRDPEQVRNEVLNIANECGNGLLWIERVQIATASRLDRDALLNRDDPIGEILRVAADLRRDASALVGLAPVEELRRKLPAGKVGDIDRMDIDDAGLAAALDEAESLLLARLSAAEAQ